jgi:hypothetical protein
VSQLARASVASERMTIATAQSRQITVEYDDAECSMSATYSRE